MESEEEVIIESCRASVRLYCYWCKAIPALKFLRVMDLVLARGHISDHLNQI